MALSLLPSPEIERLKTQIAQGQNLSGFRSPVPRISPPTAGIFARRPADPGPYPVANPYMLPKPNLFGVEPPGVGEQDLPAPFPTPDLYGMTEEQLGRQRKWGNRIASVIPSVTPSFMAQGIRALARKAELGAVDEFRRRESQDIQGGGLVDPVVPAGSVADSITWNPLPSQMGKSPARLAFDDASLPYLDDGFIPGITTNVDAAQIDDSLLADGTNYAEFHGGGFDEGGFDEGDVEEIADMDVQEFEAYS